MTQIYGIFVMVGLLAHRDKLSTFIESLTISATGGGEHVFRLLSHQVIQIIGLDRNPSTSTMTEFFRSFTPTVAGAPARTFLADIGTRNTDVTLFLLKHVFSIRDMFFAVDTNARGFGWSLLLVFMWLQIKHTGVENKNKLREKSELRGELRDLVCRYLMVAEPQEYCVVGALAEDISCIGGNPHLEVPFLEPTDSDDLSRLVRTLTIRLVRLTSKPRAAELRYYSMMAEFVAEKARGTNRPDLYPRILTAAFDRLKSEIVHRERDMSSRDKILAFGVSCVRYTW